MMTLILVTSAENNFTAQNNCQIWAIRLRHVSRCCWKGATAVSLKVVSECLMSSDEDNRPLGTCGFMRRFGVLGHDASGAVRDTVLCHRWAASPSPLMPTIPAVGRFTAAISIT